MSFILEILKSILFGIVQGITEWLPISSTGHLILLNAMMPLQVFEDASMNLSFWEMYKVVIQFGSILAVVLLYWNKLNPFSKRKSELEKKATYDLWIKIIVASIPVAIIGFLLDDLVDEKLSTPLVVAIMLILYGVLFIWIEHRNKKVKYNQISDMDYMTAGKIGFFEALAIVPGTSRSGSTILGATLLGCSRPTATEFSFFMALPAMLGASLLKLIKMEAPMTFGGFIILLVGMVVAFVVSVIVIRGFMKYIRKHDFTAFGAYRIFLGILILILVIMKLLPAGLAA